jgi:hypothetical protein
MIIVILPLIFSKLDYYKKGPVGLMETAPRAILVAMPADSSDVAQGLARKIGQPIDKTFQPPSHTIFFMKKINIDPEDPGSGYMGKGKFNIQLYVLHLLGVDLKSKSKATLRVYEYLFNLLVPIFVLFLVGYLTRQDTGKELDRFFMKLQTPVCADLEQDQKNLQAAYASPEKYKAGKMFPNSNWEIRRQSRFDYLGFLACWVFVLLMLGVLKIFVSIGGH